MDPCGERWRRFIAVTLFAFFVAVILALEMLEIRSVSDLLPCTEKNGDHPPQQHTCTVTRPETIMHLHCLQPC
jgi:hypothetical protein